MDMFYMWGYSTAINSTGAIYYCARFNWDRVYYIACTTGCCGSTYNKYCCMGTALTAGIVTAVIIAILVVALLVCMCAKKHTRSARNIRPGNHGMQPNVTVMYAGRNAHGWNFNGYPQGMPYPVQPLPFPQPPPYKPRGPPPPYLSNNNNNSFEYQAGGAGGSGGQGRVIVTGLAPGVHAPPTIPPVEDELPPAYTATAHTSPHPPLSTVAPTRDLATAGQTQRNLSTAVLEGERSQRGGIATAAAASERTTAAGTSASHTAGQSQARTPGSSESQRGLHTAESQSERGTTTAASQRVHLATAQSQSRDIQTSASQRGLHTQGN
ncbi:zinc finger and BTB domain-containing protein 4-like isoform X2 [Gigantopelta aegis]|uniref:zinc finger and BTB domain-containing protein 4-like isoform X2 n=1 Tax=Gigantopelta aegis TaxID=1735272 RepID=UPI001B88AF7C|nr:zinc finger and BTB domain-containing protein 4-like isoform X2 [Gigantopelta aegis]